MSYYPKTSSKFNRVKKRLPAKLRHEIDKHVKRICDDPSLSDLETDDLAGIRVCKFGFMGQLYVLAHEANHDAKIVYIHAVGGHENFYRDLKKYLKS